MSKGPDLRVIEGGKNEEAVARALEQWGAAAEREHVGRLKKLARAGHRDAKALLAKIAARRKAKLSKAPAATDCEHGKPLEGGCVECQKALARRALMLAVHTRALLDAVQGKVRLLGGDVDRVERELDLLDVEGLVLV